MSEHDDDDREVCVRATLTFSDASEVTVRPVYLGLSPSIYIEPVETDDEIAFVVTACDLEQDDLATVLELVAESVRSASPSTARRDA